MEEHLKNQEQHRRESIEAVQQSHATTQRLVEQLRSKERESDAAKCRVAAVEDEMRVLLQEMATQKQKMQRLHRAFAEVAQESTALGAHAV